jgi:CRISPR-associated endonuclease Csn1
MKRILGLDLGTNSIGWALVDLENNKIEGMGSRIIPMTQDVLDTFSGGKPLETQTAARTSYRGIRRIRERHLLRRERLHRVLNVLGFLPEHYAREIDFEKHFGQFVDESEPKLTYNNRDFIFISSFEEMLSDFKQSQPQLFYTKPNGKETKIPYDWTIYYLRKKALSQKITKEELAWIILNFNQKRGYYQLRGEDDADATRTAQTRIYFDSQIINSIVDTGSVYKGLKVIQITLANGDTGKYFSKEVPNWIGLQKNIIATIDLDKDGNDRFEDDGTLKRRFSIPTEEDWEKKWKLIKIKTEKEIKDADTTVGAYIYENLLQNPSQKIRGKLVRTIERKFYKDELIAILKKQIELQPELFTDDLYNDCVRELYRNNESQQLVLSKRDFVHLFVEDIIFYQRPLRSQKSSIGNCSLEYRIHKDKDGIQVKEYLKAIPKSHPLYQEFRVWQWLSNLKIYRKEDDADVTTELLKNTEDVVNLFEFLMAQKEVGHKEVLKHLVNPILKEKFPNAKPAIVNKEIEKEIAKYRWNYVFDDSKEKEEDKSKKYPCNTTGYEIRRRLEKVENIPANFLTSEIEQHLWHIIYSVTDKKEYEAALRSFANKYKLDENSFVEEFKKFPPFPSEYGAYSEKAIKKLLPLMRLGKYWCWDAIDTKNTRPN